VIGDVIQEEYNRLEALLEEYEKKIYSYPQGSLQLRMRGKQGYYYLSYRDKEDNRVKDIYIGKEESEKVAEFKKEIEERRKYIQRKKQVEKSLKELRKLLRVAS
jgi:hypothetical protein